MKYLWRIYYLFKKPSQIGKSSYIIKYYRINGIKYQTLEIGKTEAIRRQFEK